MKKNQPKVLFYSFILILVISLSSIFIISCSNDSQDTQIKNNIENNTISHKTSDSFIIGKTEPSIFHYNESNSIKITHYFKSNYKVPKFEDENELINYVNDNINHINGTFITIIDEVEYNVSVVNGKIAPVEGNSSKFPCTKNGIIKCVQDKVYNQMNFLEQMVCSFTGPVCVEKQVGNCIWENCGGEDWIRNL